MKGTDPVRAGVRVTQIGALVNVALAGLKLAAGVLGNSQALLADAAHSISDLFTDLVVLVGLRAGRRGPDDDHHFGHGRVETMASFIVAISLLGVAVYIAVSAAAQLASGVELQPTWLAVAAAAVSILCKEVLYQYTVRAGRAARSTVVVANAWHHRSDALSSIAVLIGVLGAQIGPAWGVLDAYAAVLVSLLVAKVGLGILWDAVKEFTDTAPSTEVLDDMTHKAGSIPGVLGVHDLRVRTAGGLYLVDLHVEVDGSITVTQGHAIAKQVENSLMDGIAEVSSVIVHVDPDDSAAQS